MDRQSRSRTRNNNHVRNRSHLSRSRNRSLSRNIHPEYVANTETNENEMENEINGYLPKTYITVENQLIRALVHTEEIPVGDVLYRIKDILEKIANRSPGSGYPRNKLRMDTIDTAIALAMKNPDPRIYQRRPVSINLLDTLLSHRLFKNIRHRDWETREWMPYDILNATLYKAVIDDVDIKVIYYLVNRGANPTSRNFRSITSALLKHTPKGDAIVRYFMEHPFMQKWETLHQAVEQIKPVFNFNDKKQIKLSFFVHAMFPLLEDTSDKKTKEHIIVMHDHYREYMTPEEVKKIERLYADITESMNTKLPTNVHRLLATYGGKRTRKQRKH